MKRSRQRRDCPPPESYPARFSRWLSLSSLPRLAPPRLAAGLLVFVVAAVTSIEPARAQSEMTLWSGTVTVGESGTDDRLHRGFDFGEFGSANPGTFPLMGYTFGVSSLTTRYDVAEDRTETLEHFQFTAAADIGFDPCPDELVALELLVLTVGTVERTLASATNTISHCDDSEGVIQITATWEDGTAPSWSDGDTVSVRLALSNTSRPMTSDRTVRTRADRAYVFTTNEFSFSGSGTGDVRIVSLPLRGTLRLDNSATAADRLVSRSDIVAGRLSYKAPNNASGLGYGRFSFRVSNGSQESAAHTMTVDVGSTAKPTFSGSPRRGSQLTSSVNAITRAVRGASSFRYRWVQRVGRDGERAIESGATATFYVLRPSDIGQQVAVPVVGPKPGTRRTMR